MDVAVDGHRFANLSVTLHATNGNGHIVDHTEAFPVVRKRVMKSSADADCYTVLEGMIGGQDRATCGEPEGAH